MNEDYYNDAIAEAAIEYAENNKHEPYVISDIETAFLNGAKWYRLFLDMLIKEKNNEFNNQF